MSGRFAAESGRSKTEWRPLSTVNCIYLYNEVKVIDITPLIQQAKEEAAEKAAKKAMKEAVNQD